MSELTEDIEVVSPGQLLKEGREKLGWSQQEVAQRLNLRSAVVQSLEQDRFDDKVSATFVRGYLRAYAKLLGISEELIISSYDHLGIAQVQYADMQSFSRRTSQEAHDNRLMLVTYAIAFALIALTVLWWLQQDTSSSSGFDQQLTQPLVSTDAGDQPVETPEVTAHLESEPEVKAEPETVAEPQPTDVAAPVKASEPVLEDTPEPSSTTATDPQPLQSQSALPAEAPVAEQPSQTQPSDPNLAEVVMQFTDDCWVRVEDATGERLAIGIKRDGKRMVINGRPPFKVIIGAPEAVTIQYQGKPFDTSHLKPGRTARFSIPVQE